MAIDKFGKSKSLSSSFFKRILILTFSGILMSFALNYFIIPLGILSAGLGGFAQGISYTITTSIGKADDQQLILIIYWAIVVAINIPVVVFSYFYYGKKFIYLSLYTFFVMLISSFFFSYVPGFDTASYFKDESGVVNITIAETVIMSIVGGVLYGISGGLIFSQGSTSLGIDPVTRYYGREKGYNLSQVLLIASIISSFFWIIIIQIISTDITSFSVFIDQVLFAPEILGSLLFIITYAFLVGYIYPTSRKYLVEINSKKVQLISAKLIEMNYHRGHSIEEVFGGYTKEKRLILKILINSEEFQDIVKIVKSVDEDAFLYATQAKYAYSKFHGWAPQTLEDKTIREKRKKQFNKMHSKENKKKEKENRKK
ncbi:MAG: membrane protein [Candidatus Hepatoplasma vulgare]|nr:MAG: membrane protein [Candidatus Hepatoplasma sp.]